MELGTALVIALLVVTLVSIGLGMASTRELYRAMPHLLEGRTKKEASRSVKSPSSRWPVEEFFAADGLEAARRGVRFARWQFIALLVAAGILGLAILL